MRGKAKPNLRELIYQSNHFIWDNKSFDHETKINYLFKLYSPKLNSLISINGLLQKDFLFYHTDQLPQKYSSYTGATEFRLNNFAVWKSFGIESGVSDILEFYKKQIDLDKATEIIQYADSIGIYTVGNFILGAPSENENSIQKTCSYFYCGCYSDLNHQCSPCR